MLEEYPSEVPLVGTGTDQPVASIETGVPSEESQKLWLNGTLDRLIVYGGKKHLEKLMGVLAEDINPSEDGIFSIVNEQAWQKRDED